MQSSGIIGCYWDALVSWARGGRKVWPRKDGALSHTRGQLRPFIVSVYLSVSGRRWWRMRSRSWITWTMPTWSSSTQRTSRGMTSSLCWNSMFDNGTSSDWRRVNSVVTTVTVTFSVGGGELFDRIIDENYTLMELDAVMFIRQICEGLQHMHKMFVLHLDLKVTDA